MYSLFGTMTISDRFNHISLCFAVVKSMKKLVPEPAGLDRGTFCSKNTNYHDLSSVFLIYNGDAFLQDLARILLGWEWRKVLKKQRRSRLCSFTLNEKLCHSWRYKLVHWVLAVQCWIHSSIHLGGGVGGYFLPFATEKGSVHNLDH